MLKKLQQGATFYADPVNVLLWYVLRAIENIWKKATFTLLNDMLHSRYQQWRRNESQRVTGPARKWGAPIRREAPEKFFGHAPPLFGSKSTIIGFGECFRDGQYSLVSFLLAVLLLTEPPPCPAICKIWGHVPPVPYGVGATGYQTFRPRCFKIRSQLS